MSAATRYQVDRPAGLGELPEEAVDRHGQRFAGSRARVYHLLRLVAERGLRLPVGRHLAEPGWVPRHFLVEPWSGGQQGDRRVRELRSEHGFDIETQAFRPPIGPASATMLYRLVVAGTSAPPATTRRPPAPPLAGLVVVPLGESTEAQARAQGRPLDLTPTIVGRSVAVPHASTVTSAEEYRRQLARALTAGTLAADLRPDVTGSRVAPYVRVGTISQLGWDPSEILTDLLLQDHVGGKLGRRA